MGRFNSILSIIQEDGFQKYFKNTSWLFAEKALRMIAGLIIGIWVARYLGPADYGVFHYALSFVALFITLSTLGLDGIVIRNLVKSGEDKNKLLGTSFGLKALGAVFVMGMLLIGVQFTNNDTEENILIFVIGSSTFLHSFKVIDFYFQSKVLAKFVVYSQVVSLVISSLLKVCFILTGASLIHFALVIVYESIVVAIGLIYFYKREGNNFKDWCFSNKLAKRLLTDSWPLILSGVVVSLYMKIDQIMIKEMINDTAVGNYAAAARISEMWYFIPLAITSSLFPAIVNAKERNDGSYHKRLQRLFDFMVIISVAVAVPVTIFHDEIIFILFGAEYASAAEVITIHIWAGVFVALGVSSGSWLINENLQKIALYRAIAGGIINLVLNYLLIPVYGITGAAVTTLLSQFTATVLFDLFFRRTRENFKMKIKSLVFINLIKKVLWK